MGSPGFIPAGAGNTFRCSYRNWSPTVHPRRCGEHYRALPWAEKKAGSSPQVRGTQNLIYLQVESTRFIPAGAGNTLQLDIQKMQGEVHPRRCGEHSGTARVAYCNSGSSPQVRGTRGRGSGICVEGPVHPRRCGEHSADVDLTVAASGSSPQVRGTLHRRPYPRLARRFIPAGAGNTLDGVMAHNSRLVHPRRCGEHVLDRLEEEQ